MDAVKAEMAHADAPPGSGTLAPKPARAFTILTLSSCTAITIANALRTEPGSDKLARCLSCSVAISRVGWADMAEPSAGAVPPKTGTQAGRGPYCPMVAGVSAKALSSDGNALTVTRHAMSSMLSGPLVPDPPRLVILVAEFRNPHNPGHSSVITLKSALTHRFVPSDPEQVRLKVTEIPDISCQSLPDVQPVALGYREMSLNVEASLREEITNGAGGNRPSP